MSLLDSTLDDLNDLPEYKVFPPGAHRCTIAWEEKEINKHPAIELRLTAIATEELADPTETPLSEGDESSVAFMLDNEFGVGNFKAVLKPLAAHFGLEGATNREIVEASQGAEVLVVTKLRADKNDPEKKYLSIKNLAVV